MVIVVVVDFVEKLDLFLEKKPPVNSIIFDYYLNLIPFFGNLFSPICIFLAVIFFTSRMAQRTEIVPMLGAGVSFYRIFLPYLIVAIALSGISFYFKSYMVPRATAERMDFEYAYLKPKNNIGRSKDVHKKVAPDTYVYIAWYNKLQKRGHFFSLERMIEGKIKIKIDADYLQWVDSTESWQMQNARFRHIEPKGERLVMRGNVDTTFLLTPDDLFIKELKAESMILPDLIEYIEIEKMRGSDILTELTIEMYRRYSDPVAAIILTIIGFAMASRKRRGGIAIQIGLGIVICFAYIVLLFAGQLLVGDTFPAWAAVWFPNMLFLPFGIFLLRIAPK